MKRILTIIVATVLLTGCGVGLSKPSTEKVDEAVRKLSYAYDMRTGLCFAAVSTSHQNNVSDDGMSLTYVPCTPSVMAAVKQDS